MASGGDTGEPMATRRRPTVPLTRTALAGLAVVGFAGAVALAGAGSVGPGAHGGSRTSDTVVATMAVLVGIAALGCTAIVARRVRRPPTPVGEVTASIPPLLLKPFLAPLVATLLLLLFSALVLGPCLNNGRLEPLPRIGHRPTATSTPATSDRGLAEKRPDWSVVAGLVLGATGLALALIAARNRRGGPVVPDEPALGDEIARSLADLDSLEQHPDHRRVVIRTYARMERALGRTGIAREPWETAQEYLRRAFTDLGAGAGAAGQLTDLFEQARFSNHRVDETMRARAAASLRTVGDEIATRVPSTGSTA